MADDAPLDPRLAKRLDEWLDSVLPAKLAAWADVAVPEILRQARRTLPAQLTAWPGVVVTYNAPTRTAEVRVGQVGTGTAVPMENVTGAALAALDPVWVLFLPGDGVGLVIGVRS